MRRNRRVAIRGRSWSHVLRGFAWFELRAVVVTILASIVILGAVPIGAPVARGAVPKVVIIVGPVGALTDSYRADGDRAAKAARATGATVETIYSPNATWPLVRDALQGASVVLYLGHGNGWPSRYRDAPWPKTQNGLGLNPEAGVDDHAHQYFGEAYLARAIHLAPHAVVILAHLCYASGNSEPGLPEGDLATGQQRVDNYAAGWLAAGAEAVVAEGYGDPAYYVRRILAGQGTIESIWRRAPTAHGHVLAFPSERTPGMTALMDPTSKSSGFYRSLVTRAELHAAEVARGAAGLAPSAGRATTPVSASSGPVISAVTLQGVPTAGSTLRIKLTLDKASRKSAPALGIGVRWDPISLDPPPVVPEARADAVSQPADASAASAGVPSPPTDASVPPADASAATADASGAPADPAATAADASAASAEAPSPPTDASAAPDASAVPTDENAPANAASRPTDASAVPTDETEVAPPIALISPETPGTVVNLSDVSTAKSGISAELATPPEPGLYRLVVTVHDAEGVAFDAGTQERIPAFTVRVTGELSTVVSATSRLRVAAGASIDLPVTVANTGRLAWASGEPRQLGTDNRPRPTSGEPSSALVGRWLRLDGAATTSDAVAARAKTGPLAGATEDVQLTLTAPADPGMYLLVLDVVSPLYGSLTAVGGAPMAIRVEVTPPEEEGAQGTDRSVRPQRSASLPRQ